MFWVAHKLCACRALGISWSQTQSHNRKKLMTTATKGEGEMTCPNTDGGAHGDRGHCVWQQMLCDSHQVISSTIFIIKIIIIRQQKQLAPKPILSLISAVSSFHWSFLLYFSIFPHQTIKDLSWFCVGSFSLSLKIWLWWISARYGWFEHSNDVVWKLCKEIDIYRTVDSSSTRMSGAAGGYQCSDDNDGDE